MSISEETLNLLKGLQKDTSTSGIQLGSGLSFYNLEPKAKALYPKMAPLLATTPRAASSGDAAHWKAITSIDTNGTVSVPEGTRNAFMNITTNNYYSTFKTIGKEIPVTFQSLESMKGFDDALGLAQVSQLNALINDEERMILGGNSGPSNLGGDNGFALGTPVAPVIALATGGSIANATAVYVSVVALTTYGAMKSVTTTGVISQVSVSPADGSAAYNYNTGCSKVSPSSNTVTTGAGDNSVTATATVINGAVAYAWYVGGSTQATQYFAGVTSAPVATFTSIPSSSNQQANDTQLQNDHSYNNLDFDGILTFGFNAAGGSKPSYLNDLGGVGLHANGDGTIAEFETVLDYLWLNYKIVPDAVYVGGNLINAVSKAILQGTTPTQRLNFESDAAGRLVGGTLTAAYRCKYSIDLTGEAKVLPVRTHPWLPQGVILFDLTSNPYAAAGNAIPAVRRVITLRDHFSIVWPIRRLQHELGVYSIQCMEHYIPFGVGILTGVGNTVVNA